ncbi:MAG: hypothetical protein N2557_07795 [Hydrogenophilus sp.]|nr:hypothetical protein [Hydrogenophilus sp.]
MDFWTFHTPLGQAWPRAIGPAASRRGVPLLARWPLACWPFVRWSLVRWLLDHKAPRDKAAMCRGTAAQLPQQGGR